MSIQQKQSQSNSNVLASEIRLTRKSHKQDPGSSKTADVHDFNSIRKLRKCSLL